MSSKKKILKETPFDWIDLSNKDSLPKNRLLKVVAKSPSPEGTTVHPESPEYPVRLFAEAEVMKAARSMIGKPVGLNHKEFPIYGAYVVDAEWNPEEKQAEAIVFAPEEYVQKVKEGKIDQSSIEYTWRNTKNTEKGVEFEGLLITRLDLVEGREAGDKTTNVVLFETASKTGRILGECKVLTEPFADYTDWDDCISKNQDKDNPEAYCGAIQAQTESIPPATPPKTPEVPVPAVVVPEVVTPPVKTLEERIKELETAFSTATKAHEDFKVEVDKKVGDAVKAERERIMGKFKEKIPSGFIQSKFGLGGKRFADDIKKIVFEESENAKS